MKNNLSRLVPAILLSVSVFAGTTFAVGGAMGPAKEVNAEAATYTKVTENLSDWSGTYLFVYEDGNVCFDGSLDTLDAVSNTQSVTISNDSITADSTYAFNIEKYDSGYSVKSYSGYYIGTSSNANSLKTNASTPFVNTIDFKSADEINISSTGGTVLRYNSSSDQTRFRYYKSSTYSKQKAISLYKLDASTGEEPDPTLPEVTSVTLDVTSAALNSGQTQNITATISPAEASQKLTWTSSDASVAKYQDGKIVALNKGTATLTATAANGVFATCEVTVEWVIEEKTVAEVLNEPATKEKLFKVKGKVSNPDPDNKGYGAFDLVDDLGNSILVYGSTFDQSRMSYTAEGYTYNSKGDFDKNSLKEGDVVELLAIRLDYNTTKELNAIILNVSTPTIAGLEEFQAVDTKVSLGLNFKVDSEGNYVEFSKLRLYFTFDFDYSKFANSEIQEAGIYFNLGETITEITREQSKLIDNDMSGSFIAELNAPETLEEVKAMLSTKFSFASYVKINGEYKIGKVRTLSFEEILMEYADNTEYGVEINKIAESAYYYYAA